MINQAVEEFKNKTGQFILRRDEEAIAFITTNTSNTPTSVEGMNLPKI